MPDRRRSSRTAIGSVLVEQDVTIDAPPWRVFDALTKDVAAWWGVPAQPAGDTSKRLVLEAELGGRFYEEWPGGGGALLARVTSLKRADHLELTGPIGRYGTVHGRTRFDLKPSESGAGTVVSLSARVIGESMDESTYAEGWNELLTVRLKGFVEAGRRFAPGEPLLARPAPEAPSAAPTPGPKAKKPRTRSATPRSRRKTAPADGASADSASADSASAGAAAAEAAPSSSTPPSDGPDAVVAGGAVKGSTEPAG